MWKKIIVPVMVAGVVLAGCGSSERKPDSDSKRATNIAKEIASAQVPYVTGGGTMNGATSFGDEKPGFDEAGLISFIYADCCSLAVGSSLEEIYSNSTAPEWSEEGPKDPVVGDLVFNEAKNNVGIITAQKPDGSWEMVTASRDAGVIEKVAWDKKEFSDIRVLKDTDGAPLKDAYKEWKRDNKNQSKNFNSDEFVDEEEKSDNSIVIPN